MSKIHFKRNWFWITRFLTTCMHVNHMIWLTICHILYVNAYQYLIGNISITLRSIVCVYFLAEYLRLFMIPTIWNWIFNAERAPIRILKIPSLNRFDLYGENGIYDPSYDDFRKNDLDRIHVLLTFVLFVVRQRTMRYLNWSYRWFDARLARSTERMSRISVF